VGIDPEWRSIRFAARWRTAVKTELSGGEEGLVGGSEPAVEVDEEDLMTTGNGVVRGLERS